MSSPTTGIVPQQSPAATPSAARYCEICQRDERCHCPAMKSWCSICVPPPVVRNAVANAVGPMAAITLPESEYLPVAGLTLKGIAHATAYRRRKNLQAAS